MQSERENRSRDLRMIAITANAVPAAMNLPVIPSFLSAPASIFCCLTSCIASRIMSAFLSDAARFSAAERAGGGARMGAGWLARNAVRSGTVPKDIM